MTACISPACEAQCANLDECGSDLDVKECVLSCSYYLGLSAAGYGVGCGDAYQALYFCSGTLTCDQLATEMGCEAEQAAVESNCQ